jgi:hypothetical protein
MTAPTMPQGLGPDGRQFWRDTTEAYVTWRVDEVRLLAAACRTLDRIAKLDAELADAPLTVPGSLGQLREHPLLSEQRQQYTLLARLLRQLDLPDTAERSALRSTASEAGRNLVRQRWSG